MLPFFLALFFGVVALGAALYFDKYHTKRADREIKYAAEFFELELEKKKAEAFEYKTLCDLIITGKVATVKKFSDQYHQVRVKYDPKYAELMKDYKPGEPIEQDPKKGKVKKIKDDARFQHYSKRN